VTPALEIIRVHKRLGEQVVLDDVDLEVGAGESVALLGPNGAGKSTLLRTVVDLVRPDRGEVRIGGAPATDRRTAAARVGCALGDEHAWYWRLSGRMNLQIYGRLRGLSGAEATASGDALLDELGLSAVADRTVATYSTGMRARLALARARMGEPLLIVLDEVARGLDAAAEEQFKEWLRGPERPAVVVVTHAFEQVAGVVDRVVMMQAGRIVGESTDAGEPTSVLAARVRALVR
jgi:ABC-type multidrug transport system ATPase subunit